MFNAPIDVQFSDFDIVQPDLVILLNENIRKITPTKIKVVPHLVVDVFSPSTSDNERIIKKDLFERSGVAEYWIVDPFQQLVEQWVFQESKYVLLPKSSIIRLSFVGYIEVDFETVW